MKLGLIGLPMVGKSTIYSILTEKQLSQDSFSGKPLLSKIYIRDPRVDELENIYTARKKVYIDVDLVDFIGLEKSEGELNPKIKKFFNYLKDLDGFINVVKYFKLSSDDKIDPIGDFNIIRDEMLFNDLAMIENRISKMPLLLKKKTIKKDEAERELKLMERIKLAIENGQMLNQVEMNDQERIKIKGFDFLTNKPFLNVVNMGEDIWHKKDDDEEYKNIKDYFCKLGIKTVELCGRSEMDILELDDAEERDMFLADLGIEDLSRDKILLEAYDTLNLLTFFTAGEKEVHAWSVKKSSSVVKAAGKIHSDMEKGFIRAEVFNYKDIYEHRKESILKSKGLIRLEGKNYVVIDGDILVILFNN